MPPVATVDTFWLSERGNVTLMFSFMLIPLALAIGLAVDYGRATSHYEKVQSSLDAAALATAKAMVETDSDDGELKALAKRYYDEGMASREAWNARTAKWDVAIDRVAGTIKIDVAGTVDTTLGRVANIDEIGFSLSSTASLSTKDIELGMMLDVSGSMRGTKLGDLKVASSELVDKLLADNSGSRKVRIGLAPYSTSINSGQYSDLAKDNSGQGNGNGNSQNKCVSERKGHDAFTDEPPANGKRFGGKPAACPVNSVFAMSGDKSTIKSEINALVAEGSTAGHLGIGWAWYLVSPKWKSFWPAASKPDDHDPEKLVKSVVIMTDGMFNIEYEPDNGRSIQQAQQLCANIKSDKVEVFTVGFEAPAEVLPFLKACASKPEYFFDAGDGDALRKAFSKIAGHLNDLRVSH
jgi:Flp pilus assembly protein TadG